MSILIVEDNETSAMILEIALKKRNYQTITAHNGKEALDILRSEPEIQIIVSDIMMPDMDGVELLAQIRGTPEWQEIPVIMCSTMADSDTVKKAIRAGCTDYIVKPVDPKVLCAKIAGFIKDKTPILEDRQLVMSRYDLNREEYNGIAKSLYTLLCEKMPDMEKQVQEGTFSLTQQEVHAFLEPTSVLGAGGVLGILEKCMMPAEKAENVDRETMMADYRILLRELKLLQKTLSTMVKPDRPEPDSKKGDEEPSPDDESASQKDEESSPDKDPASAKEEESSQDNNSVSPKEDDESSSATDNSN